MKLKKMVALLESVCPSHLAEADDFVGLQTGNLDWEVNKVLITLDCSERAITKAIKNKCDLIISHHPLLWPNPQEAKENESIVTKLAMLTKAKISVYSLHTNYDTKFLRYEMLAQMAIPIAEAPAKSTIIFGKLKAKTTFNQVIEKVKIAYAIPTCHYWTKSNQQSIETVAFVPGAGGFALKELAQKTVDLFITGELKWSDWIKCRDLDQSVITIGHQTEQSFVINLVKIITQATTEKIVFLQHWEKHIATG